MSERKRKQFNIEEKSRIITKLESGVSNKVLAKEYGVPHSTISGIWKQRENIKLLFDRNYLQMKKARTSSHIKIEQALLEWLNYGRTNNVTINGPILLQKANEFAKSFDEDFVCSPSWIHRFRMRHGILCRKMSGETASVVEQWMSQTLPILCEGYGPDDIFNADETVLFYNMTPDRALEFNGQDCADGTLSNMRLTIMVAANMTGSIKKKLLIVGKHKTPNSLKNVRSLPVTYEHNSKSWMTSEIFERWLRNWDAELKVNNKNIVLLVDNNPAHPHVMNLECIKLVFLPPDVTSVLRPMHQGVIMCLKSYYRRLQVFNLIQNFDNDYQSNLTVLDAILMISEAWQTVSQNTIANCFRHAGFKNLLKMLSNHDDVSLEHLFSEADDDKEDDISLVQLAQNLRPPLSAMEVEQFIDFDNSIPICASDTEVHIAQEIQQKNDGDNEEQFLIPTLNDGLNAVSVLRKIFLFKERFHVPENLEDTLIKIQRELQNSYVQQNCSE